MNTPIFKQSLVANLWENVDRNYNLYLEGGFVDYLSHPSFEGYKREVDGQFVREDDFVNLIPKSGGANDAHNSAIVFSAFENMSPNHAFDERIWVAATHTYCFEFTRDRWLDPGATREKNLKSIRAHFFGRVDGNRGIHRNNAISSLWWWAHVTKAARKEDFARSLLTFLTYTDLRAQIMERPVSSRVPQVFDAILTCVMKKVEDDPETKFFTRSRIGGEEAPYITWLKKINALGGRQLYNSHTAPELVEIFSGFISEIEEKTSGPQLA